MPRPGTSVDWNKVDEAALAVILLALPDAFLGGILAMLLTGQTPNVSSVVGLIGHFGIAVQKLQCAPKRTISAG